MKKDNFFVWYWSRGISEFLEIWKNLLSFFWRYFSMTKLTATLFSPWKRDVVFRYWLGWKPLKSLEILVDNFFSRFIGFLMRLAVVTTGLVVTVSFFLGGLILLFIWLSWPILFLLVLAKAIAGSVMAQLEALVLFLFGLLFYLLYHDSLQIPYIQMSAKELFKKKWLERVANRLGMAKKEINKNIFENSKSLASFLKSLDLNSGDFEMIVAWEAGARQKKENKKKFWLKENLDKISPIGKHWAYAYTPHLDEYATDLSRVDPTEYCGRELIGRQEELEVVKLVLMRPVQSSTLLVGDSGSGKKNLVHYLAGLIRHGQIDYLLSDSRILLFDIGRVISNVLSEGKDVDNVLHAMFHEAAYAGNVILFLENIENYLGKGDSMFHPDISAVMSQYLALPSFRVIATSTQKEYHNLVEKHEQFMKYLEVVEMKEPTEQETLEILLQDFEKMEERRVVFTLKAIQYIVASSGRYHWEVPLPERALDLAMEVLIFWQKNPGTYFITTETVDKFLELKTGMPHGEVRQEERGKLLNLEEFLHRRVIGQEEAVRQVAEALRRARTGIGRTQRPVGSFLFLGPTGVGKTETAKALAEVYYGGEEKMIRLDMSEFQSPTSLDRLIGSSELNQPGRLTSAVKDHPFSLLLLDEVEKAYPNVLDIFLQILDEGYVTDAFGEKISFRNIIVIATSNAGAPLIKNMIEEGREPEEIKKKLIDYVVANGIFRLELLNRFDDIIFFQPLEGNVLRSVAQMIMKKFARRLQEEKNIEIEFDDGVVDKVISSGYDPIFGARSLQRHVEDKIEDLVAKEMIAGKVKKGEVIKVSTEN
ncbi:MAG: AAA family ATPase [Candidatus Moranbacteria bacterium]|nr:AAA family ATPase [Candidatus Moranbacteria bacterium]